jgi:hypothetical protein
MIVNSAATAAEFVRAWSAVPGLGRSYLRIALEGLRRIAAIDRSYRRAVDTGNADAIKILEDALTEIGA